MATTPQGEKYKVIELPYHGCSISMLIVLPSEENTPLSHIVPHINAATVQSWTKLMHMRKVRLLIPKWEQTPCSLCRNHLWMDCCFNLCRCVCVSACVYVCRFTAEAELNLEEPLMALGISDMFSEDKADFRHLSEWKATTGPVAKCRPHVDFPSLSDDVGAASSKAF